MIRAVLAAVLFALAAPTAAEDETVFRVCHADEDDIGAHIVRRSADGARTVIETEIALSVFFGLWTFDSLQKEIWIGDRIIAFESRTLDDGEDHDIRAEATTDGLDMRGHEHRTRFPADAAPENFWNPIVRERDVLFDTKKGRRRDVVFVDEGADEISINGKPTPARRWRIEGDIDRTLWYDGADRLLRVDFVEKERAFTIRRGVCGG